MKDTDPITAKTNEIRPPEDLPQPATSGQFTSRREQAGKPSGPSKTMPTREFLFTRTSFHDISDTSSSSESTSDDDEFETPFFKMSFKEFERFQKAKTEALEKFYNDLCNAASRASASSAPPPAASKPREAPRHSKLSAASSSTPPP